MTRWASPCYFKKVTFNLFFNFFIKKRELVDLATISDQEIQNDDVIYMLFAKEVGGGWEDLQVDVLSSFGQDAEIQV